MKRRIISIDETKCTGCGQCIPDCPEGALQLIDGKARLVSDLFCDGLGACIGTCPEKAISVIEREAEPYDETKVMETIARQGAPVIRAHLEHLAGHGQVALYNQAIEYLIEHTFSIPEHTPPERMAKKRAPAPSGRPGTGAHQQQARLFKGCPGLAARSIPRDRTGSGLRQPSEGATESDSESELRQWPIQLALQNPAAPYFDNADLLISADCAPFAFPRFHEEFLRGKILIIFCPKLDADIEGYIEKLTAIFSQHAIKSVTILRMEVPCCGGIRYIVDKARAEAGATMPVEEMIVTIDGKLKTKK